LKAQQTESKRSTNATICSLGTGKVMCTKVRCPNPECGMSVSVSEEGVRRTARCKRCGSRFTLSLSQDGSAASSASASSPVPAPPTVIDRYEIRERLGSGVFGTVYRAYDPRLDREVALKILRPQAFASRQAVKRFQREARAMARLLHPHIVPVYDAGQYGEHLYIASGLIRGRTLALAIPDGGLDPRRAVWLAIQLAEALSYAHKAGVVHRDVKPSNIMIDDEDILYLTDFGLAARMQPTSGHMTKQGGLLGTPAYMAPEQARGEPEQVGPAADLYSAGVVLYEMLTGRAPFEGPAAAVVYNALHSPPLPPSCYRAGLDPNLDSLCLKALAKRAEDRFAGGEEMAAALHDWLLRPELLGSLADNQSATPHQGATPMMDGACPSCSRTNGRMRVTAMAAKLFLSVLVAVGVVAIFKALLREPAAPLLEGEAKQPVADVREKEARLQLTFDRKPSTIEFLPIADLKLTGGESKTVEVRVERKGFSGPISIELGGLPKKVTAKVPSAVIDSASDTTRLELTAADDVQAADVIAHVRTVEPAMIEAPLRLIVQKAPTFRLMPVDDVILKPGEQRTVELWFLRRGLKGLIDVRADDFLIKPGVSVKIVDRQVAPGQTTFRLELTALDSAGELKKKVRLTAGSGWRKVDAEFMVTVQAPKEPVNGQGSLIAAAEDFKRCRSPSP
jgi:serine/threonine protein kinase